MGTHGLANMSEEEVKAAEYAAENEEVEADVGQEKGKSNDQNGMTARRHLLLLQQA